MSVLFRLRVRVPLERSPTLKFSSVKRGFFAHRHHHHLIIVCPEDCDGAQVHQVSHTARFCFAARYRREHVPRPLHVHSSKRLCVCSAKLHDTGAVNNRRRFELLECVVQLGFVENVHFSVGGRGHVPGFHLYYYGDDDCDDDSIDDDTKKSPGSLSIVP